MTKLQMWGLFLLRITIGWLFLNAGIAKVIEPTWSAAKYLSAATTFNGFFGWLASSSMLPIVNFLVEWGLVLMGLALILGVCVRYASYAGAVLMFLFYLPVLNFPTVGHGYIVDDHIIYIAALLTLAGFEAGTVWGLENKVKQMFAK